MDPPSLLEVITLAAAFVLTGMSLSAMARTLGRGGVNVEDEVVGGRGIAVEIRCPSVIQPCCTIHSSAGSRNVGGTGLGDMLGTGRGSTREHQGTTAAKCAVRPMRTGSMRTTLNLTRHCTGKPKASSTTRFPWNARPAEQDSRLESKRINLDIELITSQAGPQWTSLRLAL